MIEHSPLGQKSQYISQYDSSLLFPIPRKIKRDEIKLPSSLPFVGCDIWNAFELSWLNNKGKPVVAVAQFIFPCESPHLIESKSFKLYLNSLNQTSFNSKDSVAQILTQDLSESVGAKVIVKIDYLDEIPSLNLENYSSYLLDDLDIEIDCYELHPEFLTNQSSTIVTESVSSNLLKSNCLVTGQPDWGSVQISYRGPKIDHAGLLRYIISFRNHNEFHEQCVERIFYDVMRYCSPESLTVEARYTRRGGLDINPFRTTVKDFFPKQVRLYRQ